MIIKPGDMVQFFPSEVESENFKVEHQVLTEDRVKLEKMRSAFNPHQYMETRGLKAGTYIRLIRTKPYTSLVMSDTPMEINTNWRFIHNSNGHCLVGGLGVGLVLLSAQDRGEVKSILVVEKEQEIIDLVLRRLPVNDKVTVICDDILTWRPEKGVLFDTIYFDIWDTISGDNNSDICKLHRSFARKLNRHENPEAWMTSWRLDDVRRLAYEENAYSRRW
jgi:hypothetical protein